MTEPNQAAVAGALREAVAEVREQRALLDAIDQLVRDLPDDHDFDGEERGEQCQVCLFVARYDALRQPEGGQEKPDA